MWGAFGKTNAVIRGEVGGRDGDSRDLRILMVLRTLVPSKSPREICGVGIDEDPR